MGNSSCEFTDRVMGKLKSDIFKAQRMYLLAQKFSDRVSPCVLLYCRNNLNNYIRIAKEMNLKLTDEELHDRLFDR